MQLLNLLSKSEAVWIRPTILHVIQTCLNMFTVLLHMGEARLCDAPDPESSFKVVYRCNTLQMLLAFLNVCRVFFKG